MSAANNANTSILYPNADLSTLTPSRGEVSIPVTVNVTQIRVRLPVYLAAAIQILIVEFPD